LALIAELGRAAASSGVGLAIADRIARLHHGEVSLLSRAGGGLEARVSFRREPCRAQRTLDRLPDLTRPAID
ncbi:MAG: ATP-binding protein, partial [Candidatus Binatia bacterium]